MLCADWKPYGEYSSCGVKVSSSGFWPENPGIVKDPRAFPQWNPTLRFTIFYVEKALLIPESSRKLVIEDNTRFSTFV